MKILAYLLSLLLVSSCNTADEPTGVATDTLASLTQSLPFTTGTVIACASGVENSNAIRAYFYPRPGVADFRYFETEDVTVDPQQYSNYTEVILEPEDLFNGYLKFYQPDVSQEKWVIISFMEGDSLQLSNPIRLKQVTQNSVFTDEVGVSDSMDTSPQFDWSAIAHPEDAIYFQVISTSAGELLSGTYTLETQFQYYNTDNVVLNITTELPPPDLIPGQTYQITIMGVSEDNWVNVLAIRTFQIDPP